MNEGNEKQRKENGNRKRKEGGEVFHIQTDDKNKENLRDGKKKILGGK